MKKYIGILGALFFLAAPFLAGQAEEPELVFEYVLPGLTQDSYVVLTDGGAAAEFHVMLVEEGGLTPWPGTVNCPACPPYLGIAWEVEAEFGSYQQIRFYVGQILDDFAGSMVIESTGPLVGSASLDGHSARMERIE